MIGASREAERRWPDWVAPEPGAEEVEHFSSIDADWQNAESAMQRSAFEQGAAWQREQDAALIQPRDGYLADVIRGVES